MFMGNRVGMMAALHALVRMPRAVVEAVHRGAVRMGQALRGLNGTSLSARAGSAKRNGKGKRGKYKGRLHARQGSRKRGSGRTARRYKAKQRRLARV